MPSFDRFMRPDWEVEPVNKHRRHWWNLTRPIRKLVKPKTPSNQYTIPLALERRPPSKFENGIIRFSLWSFRTKMFRAFMALLFWFFIFIWIFSILIFYAVLAHYRLGNQECMAGWDYVNAATWKANFYVAFSASWTTYTTVGYGTISPLPDDPCRGVRYLLCVEAFFGVMFSSFCGAILFAKLSRLDANANVQFSSAVCLQYGSGTSEAKLDVLDDTDSVEGEEKQASSSSFPILEMRVFNEQSHWPACHIVDASVKCIAKSLHIYTEEIQPHPAGTYPEGMVSVDTEGILQVKRSVGTVQLTPDSHPYFCSAPWYFRHVLDQDSPLLKASTRKQIEENGGNWPSELNNYQELRKCMNQDIFEIIIVFEGTSNASSGSVFCTHTYKLEDIYIGWEFVGMSFTSPDGKTCFDQSLLNDIKPQRSRVGCEPIGERHVESGVIGFALAHQKNDDDDEPKEVVADDKNEDEEEGKQEEEQVSIKQRGGLDASIPEEA